MRPFAVGIVALAALVAAGCGSEDTSLEDLGAAVQATAAAQATIDTDLATRTPQPTATPEPESFDDIRELGNQARDLRSLLEFLDARLGDAGTPSLGSLGDADGALSSGWLEACCARQWDSAGETLTSAVETLASVRAFYTDEEPSEGHIEIVTPMQADLDNLRSALDAIPGATTIDEARGSIASGREIVDRIDAAAEALLACCDPAPVAPTPSPTT